MAYFPRQVMPKSLRRETADEIDNSPAIYNAKDYNVHHREIRAIQQLLIGTSPASSGSTEANSISDVVLKLKDIAMKMSQGGLMVQCSGTIPSGYTVPIPSNVLTTKTTGTVLSGASTITVESTAGFPESGTITKINANPMVEYCVGGGYPGGGGACGVGQYKFMEYQKFIGGSTQRTFQEYITYSGKTDTTFLNCSRGVYGSTAEDISSGYARIFCGKASLFLTHNAWATKSTDPLYNQVYITYDATMKVNAAVLERGSIAVVKAPIQELIEIMYSLTVIGDFEVPNVAQAYSPSVRSDGGNGSIGRVI